MMRRITVLLIAVAAVASVIAFGVRAFRSETQAEVSIFVAEMPAGYGEWRFTAGWISLAAPESWKRIPEIPL